MLGVAQALELGIFQPNKKNVAIIYQEDAYGKNTKDFIVDKLKAFSILKKRNIAILLAEQNLPFASRVAYRYMILSQGEKVSSGVRANLSNHEEIMSYFMGQEA